MSTLTQWRLKKGQDRRFRSGHPWVYSNELQGSPQGIEAGAPIELQDPGGGFLARGYGNPASLIAFRTVSRNPGIPNPLSEEAVFNTLQKAWNLRQELGLVHFSFRLCFGEADSLPGLIIDRYLLENQKQIFVVQAHTAGMDRALPQVTCALQRLSNHRPTTIIYRNDAGARKLEGLDEKPATLLPNTEKESLKLATLLIRTPEGSALPYHVDLIEGQKTGFFLDQVENTHLLLRLLSNHRWIQKPTSSPLKILDLCCYVGQWGTQLGAFFSRQKNIPPPEITGMDASQEALDLAKMNVEHSGARFKGIRGNVLEKMDQLFASEYDLVISDPPAFIKGKKSMPTGSHAYLQLNTQAIRTLKPGGLLVSCSCSALLKEISFTEILAKAARRNHSTIQWIARGGQSPDHPMLAEFPEGQYLKTFIGIKLSESTP